VKLLELKRLLEEYVVSGVHLEQSPDAAEPPPAGRPWRSQNDILRSVGDVSTRVVDVMRQLSGGEGRRAAGPSPALTDPRTVQLTAPGYLVEQLAALRPRLERLVAVTGAVSAAPDSALRRLETTLVNVKAAVDMTVDAVVDDFPYQHALLPGVHGNQRRPAVQTANDGYERVRRPNRGGAIRRYDPASGLSNLTKGRIAAAHMDGSPYTLQWAAPSPKIAHSHGDRAPSNMWFLRRTRVHNPQGISIGSAVLHSSRQNVCILYSGPPSSPLKSAPSHGDL